ncbi:Uma2 family endonuclease [Ruegeria sp.]|uniref:Uma2 family endonuclease n=1 Tax=Ruegeria sp. TaxID=1879320 RepID=UPI003AFFA7DD
MVNSVTAAAENKYPATYKDVIDAPPNMVAQILDGTLHTHPRPAFLHGRAAYLIGGELMHPFDRGDGGPGGWWILFEQEIHLGDDVIVPDLAGWRRETMPEPPETPFVAIAPDWACEVLSPSTRQIDLGPKRNICKRNEVLTHFLPRALAPALSDFPYRNRDKDFLHGVDDGVPPLVGR